MYKHVHILDQYTFIHSFIHYVIRLVAPSAQPGMNIYTREMERGREGGRREKERETEGGENSLNQVTLDLQVLDHTCTASHSNLQSCSHSADQLSNCTVESSTLP